MDRDQLKYGTDHTSVKVKQVPGGTSSISLGWEPEQRPKYSKPAQSRTDYSNYESRGQNNDEDYYPSQPKVQSRGGNQLRDFDDDSRGDRRQEYNPRANEDYGRGNNYKNPRANDDYDDYSRGDTYSRDTYSKDPYSKDPYSRDPYSRDPSSYETSSKTSNQGRGDTGSRIQNSNGRNEGYGKNQDSYGRGADSNLKAGDSYGREDSYGRGGDSYGRGGDSYGRGGDTYGRGADTNARESAKDHGRGYNDSGYDRGYSSKDPYNNTEYSKKEYPSRDYQSSNYDRDTYEKDSYSQSSRRVDPGYDDYDSRSYKQNDRRNYDDDGQSSKSKAKTSVKVKNPPGGQSSFIFG